MYDSPAASSPGGKTSIWWGHIKLQPPDPILGITVTFKKDTHPKKINLGVGVYRDDEGNPYVLPSIRQAEENVNKKRLNHEYAPIGGEISYAEAVVKLAFGENSTVIKEKSNCTVQALSGTGALRLGLEFITKNYAKNKEVWVSSPTWNNHLQIMNILRLPYKNYRYYDPKTRGFNMQGALDDISNIPEESIILLQACAHNPTGVDPTHEEWQKLSQAIKARKLLVFFDMAYQGFATGNVNNDAFAVRKFVENGHQIMLAQSFAKNMGLYGERAGALTFLCGDSESAARMKSQLEITIRTMYSSPPLYGARLVTEILNDRKLYNQWLIEVKGMADRIIEMRNRLRSGIEDAGNRHSWKHITDQIGMFCFTGLDPNQVERLTEEFHIYLTKDGRISIAGISSTNVDYVAEAMHKVTN